jgi:hypothetical protein
MSNARLKQLERIRTSLERVTPSATDTFEVKRDGWRDLGILVIDVNHGSLTNAERAFIENIGTKFYGRRPINGSR